MRFVLEVKVRVHDQKQDRDRGKNDKKFTFVKTHNIIPCPLYNIGGSRWGDSPAASSAGRELP